MAESNRAGVDVEPIAYGSAFERLPTKAEMFLLKVAWVNVVLTGGYSVYGILRGGWNFLIDAARNSAGMTYLPRIDSELLIGPIALALAVTALALLKTSIERRP